MTRAVLTYREYAAGTKQEYSNALRASGRDPVAPPPFGGLALVPASLFP